MARPKSEGPVREPGVPVRFLPIERKYAEAAREKYLRETLRAMGIGSYALSEFMRAATMERAERILGVSLEAFAKESSKDRRHTPGR